VDDAELPTLRDGAVLIRPIAPTDAPAQLPLLRRR
jgi:hypothetical protein